VFRGSATGTASGAANYQPVGYVQSMYKGGKRGQDSQSGYQTSSSAQARFQAAAATHAGQPDASFKSKTFNGTPTFNNSYRF
jgi:hypothetical protein